jgi:hypothetical protein
MFIFLKKFIKKSDNIVFISYNIILLVIKQKNILNKRQHIIFKFNTYITNMLEIYYKK